MDDVHDVIINLVAAVIGVLAGWTFARLRQLWRQRRVRHFWGPMASRGITVVIGEHDKDATEPWERSGMVGLGCATALINIQRELQEIGSPVRVSTVGDLTSSDRERDLVLLGGPDANGLTAAVMGQYEAKLSLGFPGWREHRLALHDRVTGTVFMPRLNSRRDISIDYGLVSRMPNPLSNGNKTEVLILAGCWGYGTAGAGEAVCDSGFLRHEVVRASRYFEAVVETAVHANAAHYREPKLIRELELRGGSK